MKDACAELDVAALLLTEKSFTLEYEKYAASGERGPDYTVTFKTRTPFNVEVRRIRAFEVGEGAAEAQTVKLMAVLCDKVGQMPAGMVNVLWLMADAPIPQASLMAAATVLRELAERKADDFFAARGFAGAADFLKQYQRLSAVVLRQSAVVWTNPLARHKAPPEIVSALRRAASG